MKPINLGDTRNLEQKQPELMEGLLKATDTQNPSFQSPEFHTAMNDTRRGVFETLEAFLANIHETSRREKELEYYSSLRKAPQNQHPHGNGIHLQTSPVGHG